MASKSGGAERGATKFGEGGTPKAPRGASKFGAKTPKAPRGLQKFYEKGGTTGI